MQQLLTSRRVWTSANNPQPDIVNGSITGRYRKSGKSVLVYIELVMGAGTTYGTAGWAFSLPFTAVASKYYLGTVLAWDNGTAANRQQHFCQVQSTTTLVCYNREVASSSFSPTVPFTWASGDVLRMQAEYEAQ